jgi:hypothetical protein
MPFRNSCGDASANDDARRVEVVTHTEPETSVTTRSRARSIGLLIVVAGGLLYWSAFKLYTGILLEDALISFRYAENLASGLGFTYNPGEAVLGMTSPLLTLAAAGRLFGIAAIPVVATVSMAAASVGTAVLIALLVERAGNAQRQVTRGPSSACS